MKRNVVSVVLAVVLALGLIPTTAFAVEVLESGDCGKHSSYILYKDGLLVISGSGEIEDGWLNDERVKSVVIENGVTAIGDSTFNGCENLISVSIPDSVTNIGEVAFAFCKSLKKVTIPGSVTRIEKGAFDRCSSLSNIVIPNSVTSIGEQAFYECSSLTDVIIPNGVNEIGWWTFKGCNALTSLSISNGVTTIGEGAFEMCSSLTNVTIPSSVTNIWGSAFSGCSSLTEIQVDSNNPCYTSDYGVLLSKDQSSIVCYPGGKAGEYTVPSNVRFIGGSAFSQCNRLTEITIHAGVAGIGLEAFCECSNLIAIHVDSNNPYYSSEDGVLFNKDQSSLISCPSGKAGTYKIPDGVINIESWAFGGCNKLTSVTIPDSVTSIGRFSFFGCNSLTNVDIVKYVARIELSAFERASDLISVTIPDGVTTIEANSFLECNGLTSVAIPDSVTDIDISAFWGCDSLADVYYSGTTSQWTKIKIGKFNDPLFKATIHYSTSTIPRFTDVPENAWYADEVDFVAEKGLMIGKGANKFIPKGDVTVAEAITMAARIHSIYTTGSENFVASGQWYQVYLDYAYKNGIITKAYYNSDVNQKATRAQFAEIFANALPADGLSPMNSVADNAIPDVKMSASYAASVYKLYRAGILAGGNAKGTFSPGTFITRAECAAIVSRMAESNNRVTFTLN